MQPDIHLENINYQVLCQRLLGEVNIEPCGVTILSDIIIALKHLHSKAMKYSEQKAINYLLEELSKHFESVEAISKRKGVAVILVRHYRKSCAIWVRKTPVTHSAYKTFKKVIEPYAPDYNILYRLYDRADIMNIEKETDIYAVPEKISVTWLIWNRFISADALAFLLYFLKKGGRILVFGEKMSGKIALVSAIFDALRDVLGDVSSMIGSQILCEVDSFSKIPLGITPLYDIAVHTQIVKMPDGKLTRRVTEIGLLVPDEGKKLLPIFRWIPEKDEYEWSDDAFKLLCKRNSPYYSISYVNAVREISRLAKILTEMVKEGIFNRDMVRNKITKVLK